MKKYLAILLVLMMMVSVAACGGGSDSGSSQKPDTTQPTTSPAPSAVEGVDALEGEDLSYVMIYNPQVYSENALLDVTARKTGDFGTQIDVDIDRADGLEEESEFKPISQSELMDGITWQEVELEDNRGESFGIDYSLGDLREFYCGSPTKLMFECVYAGEYCYVWNAGYATDAELQELGECFDEELYEDMVADFGEPRFVGETGKVNLLCYPMGGGVCGFFWMPELYTELEQAIAFGIEGAASYGFNSGHAIIHINTLLVQSDMTSAKSTAAHEFQHLLSGTSMIYAGKSDSLHTWLNEAMSGYVEEVFFPGIMESDGRYRVLMTSDAIRKGQSLFNFDNDYPDIGVYGSVYVFSEYLTDLAGEDVFSNIHGYLRNSYSDTLCEAEALRNAVPEDAQAQIDSVISYPSDVEFDSEDEEWVSKLALDFYLAMLSGRNNLSAYEHYRSTALLYDQLDGTSIQGGGRVILAVKDGKFQIPEDAESGLIYVGLDEDFQVVTDFVYA